MGVFGHLTVHITAIYPSIDLKLSMDIKCQQVPKKLNRVKLSEKTVTSSLYNSTGEAKNTKDCCVCVTG